MRGQNFAKAVMLLPLLAAASFSGPAKAAAESVEAEARIVEEIQFALLLAMDFGTIAPNPAGGTVVLDASNGQRDCSGALACTGSFSVSELRVSGTDALVTVNYSSNIQLNGPGDPMTVTPDLPGGPGQTFNMTGGSMILRFGATLNTNANQVPGPYSGPFTVNVSYQ